MHRFLTSSVLDTASAGQPANLGRAEHHLFAKLPPTYVHFWRWVEEWLEKPIPAGHKSLFILHLVITATTVNKAVRNMVLDNAFVLDILTLLQATMQDHPKYRTVEFHNRELSKSDHCRHIVTYVQRYRIRQTRAVVATTRGKPMAFMSYACAGQLTEVSEPMVRYIHAQWKQLASKIRQVRQSQRCSPTMLTNILVADGHKDRKILGLHGSINKRCASIPVIVKGSRSMQRAPGSKSLPRLWEMMDE